MHAPLFTAPVLLVEQPHRLHRSEGHYEVVDERGHPLAHVNEHMSSWRGLRAQHRPHTFTIYDTRGRPLIVFSDAASPAFKRERECPPPSRPD